jgi:hypothetical protein
MELISMLSQLTFFRRGNTKQPLRTLYVKTYLTEALSKIYLMDALRKPLPYGRCT